MHIQSSESQSIVSFYKNINKKPHDIHKFKSQSEYFTSTALLSEEEVLFDLAENGPLHEFMNTVEYLKLKDKFDFNIVDDHGYSLLHIAVIGNQYEIVKFLLEEFNFELCPQKKQPSPLVLAIELGHKSIIELFLYNGSITEIKNLLFQNSFPSLSKENRIKEIADLLISTNYLMNELIQASANSQFNFILSRVNQFANANASLKKEILEFVFEISIIQKNFEIAEKLLKKEDVQIDKQDQNGDTCLHRACFDGELDVVRFLIEKFKANVGVKNKNNFTAFYVAHVQNHTNITSYLYNNIGCKDEVQTAFYEDILRNVFKNFNEKDSNKLLTIALHEAIANNHPQYVEKLMQNKANANAILEGDSTKFTMLHFACEKGNVQIVNTLLKYGGLTDLGDANGNTALHVACGNNKKDIAEVLLNKNPRLLNTQNNLGSTALHTAAFRGYFTIVHFLLLKRADKKIANHKKLTALMCAQISGHASVAHLLSRKLKTK